MTENLINRISFYLASGGLFNPELADHIAVRTLLFECREALAQRTWIRLTNDEIDQGLLCSDYTFKTAEAWRAGVIFAMTKLNEKNT